MKFKSVFTLIFYNILFTSCNAVKERFVELPLDQFNFFNNEVFAAKYYINDNYWAPNGPIYIYTTSGGFENHQIFLESGLIHDLAVETNGMLLSMEQRFFEETQTGSNFTFESFQYLTIDQSLADIAMFIDFIRQSYNGASNSKVVLWGRGYGASFAVWMRQKYPHLVDAVFASSAYLNLRYEYPELITNSFNTYNLIGGSECGDVITGAMRYIEEAIQNRDLKEVEEGLKFCSSIDLYLEENLSFLFATLANGLSNFISDSSTEEISGACEIMKSFNRVDNSTKTDFEGFAYWYSEYKASMAECLEFDYFKSIDFARNGMNHPIYGTSLKTTWVFCSKKGSFGTSNRGQGHPFGTRFERDYFVNLCTDLFGSKIFNENFKIQKFFSNNISYGGLNPEVTKVIFTQGGLNPRRNLGPQEDLNDLAPVVVMPRKYQFNIPSNKLRINKNIIQSTVQSQGTDLGSISDSEDRVLRETKERVRATLLQWIESSE
jgi:thymus-specific serine protease